jgi:hypothetical protein
MTFPRSFYGLAIMVRISMMYNAGFNVFFNHSKNEWGKMFEIYPPCAQRTLAVRLNELWDQNRKTIPHGISISGVRHWQYHV